MTLDPARRRPARHRVERPRRQLRTFGADHRRRGGVGGAARAAHRDLLDRVRVRRLRIRDRADRRRIVAVPRRPGQGARRVGRRLVSRGAPRRSGGRSATVELLRARRPRRDPAPLSQDPSLLARRRGALRARRHRAGDGRRRGIPGVDVRVLRPSLRRRVLAARRSRPTCTSCPPTGPRNGASTG